MKLNKIFSNFNNLNVLIIGDVMIDSYMWGTVTRISPEAPVPVVAVTKKENRLGGAANVALNIQAMGAKPILCSILGDDEKSKVFIDLMNKQKLNTKGLITVKGRTTTVKTRILGSNHQMMRVDEEEEDALNPRDSASLLTIVKQLAKQYKPDVIIFEDYDKGVLTPNLIKEIVTFARKNKIPTVVDPKKKNFMSYAGTSLFKPNIKELKEGLKIEFNHENSKELTKAVDSFLKKQNIESALITLSEKGIYIHSKNVKSIIPAHLRDITDVSGAGDTVVSIAALCLALNLEYKQIAMLANLAGGLVCEKAGVVPINKKELLQEAERLNF